MLKTFALLFVAAALSRGLANEADDFQKLSGEERVARARAAHGKIIAQKFKDAGLPYPAREIFLCWFKREAVVELWAREDLGVFRLIATYEILATSGGPGPKRRQGDRQVPEGLYEIDRFNPESLFHLSLGLNYPNAADRILSDRDKPGGDIFIHGKNVSIGCAPIGDAAIEQLYLAALDTHARGQTRIPVHIFPARMRGVEWAAFAAEQIARDPALAGFWQQLQPAYDAFERDHLVPAFTVEPNGNYRVTPAP